MKTKIPVTVATGFLGSGKTTLINHILTAEHGKKIAVIENEYGEISIDQSLVKQKLGSNEEIFEVGPDRRFGCKSVSRALQQEHACRCFAAPLDLMWIFLDHAAQQRLHLL